jgi:2-iminobutanoate/2-iminopropanoate deaminase
VGCIPATPRIHPWEAIYRLIHEFIRGTFGAPTKNAMKKIIKTSKAPAPVGPYNQAIIHNDTLYASGQIALDPATGALITETIEAETTQVMHNIQAILEEAGLSFKDVVKASVFVTDINNFARINAVYATYFDEASAPARELVQVSALPKGGNVEISIIAAFD